MAIALEMHRHRGKKYPELEDHVWVGEIALRNMTHAVKFPGSPVTSDQRRAMRKAIHELVCCGYVASTPILWKTSPWKGPRKCYRLAAMTDLPEMIYNPVGARTEWPANNTYKTREQSHYDNEVQNSQLEALAAGKTVWPSLPLWEMPKLCRELRERTTGAAEGYLNGKPSIFNDATGRTINNTKTLAGTCSSGLNVVHVATFETYQQKRTTPAAIVQLGQNGTEQMFLLLLWLFALPLPENSKHLPPLTVYNPKTWAMLLGVHPKSLRNAAQNLLDRGIIFRAKEGRGAHATGILTSAIACTPKVHNALADLQRETKEMLANVELNHHFDYNPATGNSFEKPRTMREKFRAQYNCWRCAKLAKTYKAQKKVKATAEALGGALQGLAGSATTASVKIQSVFENFTEQIPKVEPYNSWIQELQS